MCAMTTPEVPRVNARVELRLDGTDDWFRSRVEDLDDGTIVVGTPTDDRGVNVVARIDDHIVVFWHTDTGPKEVDTELIDTSVGTLSLWTLRPIGPARGASRRAFFRVNMTAPIELLGDHAGIAVTLRDLSEGGMRCHLRTTTDLPEGTAFDAALTLEGTRVVVAAEVVRAQRDELGQEVSCRFCDMAPVDADTIRQALFAEQRRLRAKGLA